MKTLGVGKYLRLIQGRNEYEYIEEVEGHGAVGIYSFTEDNEMVLMEQYRPPVGAAVIEMPGGPIGDNDPSERPMEAAARELREETGYKSGKWTFLGEFPPSPAYSSHSLHLYKAENSYQVGPGGGVDVREDITVHTIPVDDVTSFLLAKKSEGILADPKLYAGLYFR